MNNSTTLEDKIKRLKEIQLTLEMKPTLTESMKLLEEAFELKTVVEKELVSMENKLIDLSKPTEV